jgi:hypothetical protein
MKRLILFLTLILNGYIFADGHASPPMTAHYGFSTSNPAAVVESLQKFMASDCGKEMPASVTLFEPHFNADNEASHILTFNYQNGKGMDAVRQTFQTCAAAQQFLADGVGVINQEYQALSTPIYAGGNAPEANVYMLWQMKVTDEAKYAAAYKKMMEAQTEDGLASGSYGVNRIMAGGVDGMTHFAYIFGSSMAEMTEALSVSQASDNFKRFVREVESIREIITVDAGYTLIQY